MIVALTEYSLVMDRQTNGQTDRHNAIAFDNISTNLQHRSGATGKVFRLAISRLRVQILLEATLRNNLGQVV